MQNGNPKVTVFYVCALSLWERVGVRASGRKDRTLSGGGLALPDLRKRVAKATLFLTLFHLPPRDRHRQPGAYAQTTPLAGTNLQQPVMVIHNTLHNRQA